jgi:hypothetical protein
MDNKLQSVACIANLGRQAKGSPVCLCLCHLSHSLCLTIYLFHGTRIDKEQYQGHSLYLHSLGYPLLYLTLYLTAITSITDYFRTRCIISLSHIPHALTFNTHRKIVHGPPCTYTHAPGHLHTPTIVTNHFGLALAL